MNDHKTCVSEAVDGLLLTNSKLSVIEGESVVVRSDIHTVKQNQVTILSGGGSGHEPAHAGYIGDGMLSGAILGKVFASPSVSAILTAIRTCCGSKGLLIIIKNYTGDRLNFGMAIERAKTEGFKVEMVVVDDDCALDEGKGITGGRGVAGTIFVHKLAGCAAYHNATLNEVYQIAYNTTRKVKTLGAALSVCTVPGCLPSNRLDDSSIEMAIGIHAEPGQVMDVSRFKTMETSLSVSDPNNDDDDEKGLSCFIASSILDKILGNEKKGIKSRSQVNNNDENNNQIAVLINNLGGTSELEMSVFAKDVMNNLLKRNLKPVRCYIGSFMTSLEMAGVSVSILP
jgi:dihydroxyacetone kinase